jgi:hypothetical protein
MNFTEEEIAEAADKWLALRFTINPKFDRTTYHGGLYDKGERQRHFMYMHNGGDVDELIECGLLKTTKLVRVQTTVSIFTEVEVPREINSDEMFRQYMPESHLCPDGGWCWEGTFMWYGEGDNAGEEWEEFISD